MPIKATTPTSAGFAQAFDTSGLVSLAAEQKAQRDKKLAQSMVEYDTKGIFKRDIPKVQSMVKDFERFTMANAEAISNPSANIETWSEWKDMQDKIKNTITYSTAAKETYHNALTKLGNPRWSTEENKDLLLAYSQTPSDEQYEDLTAYAEIFPQMNRNTQVKLENYSDIVNDMVQLLPPSETGKDIAGKSVYAQGKSIEIDDVKEVLRNEFNMKSESAADLRYIYGEGEEGLTAFAEDMAKRVQKSPKYGLAATAAVGKKTAGDIKRESAIVTRTGSGHTTIETKYDPARDDKVFKYTDDSGEKHDAVQTWGVGTVGGADNVMMFYPDLRINKNITEAQDMTTGKMLKPGEGKRYKYQIPLERATYMVADKRIEYTYTDKNGKKVKNVFDAGETVPDFDKMLADKAITKSQHRDLTAKVHSMDGYMVYATTEQVDYFDLAEGEDVMNILKGKGGRILNVPAYTISPEVDQQLMYKYDTNQAYYAPEQAARPKYNIMDVD